MAAQPTTSLLGERASRTVDAPVAIGAAAYLIALNQLVANVQPLLLGGLAKEYGFNDRQLGHVSAVYIGFITACTLTAPLWVRRVNWRWLSGLTVSACVVAFLWGATLTAPAMLMALFALLGTLKGCFGAPAFASLGDSSNPDRAYGIAAIFQCLSAAAIAAPVSALVIPKYGVSGLFLTLAVLYATGLLASYWMPARGRHVAPVARTAQATGFSLADTAPALIASLAAALFVAAVLAFWYYVERIGTARGVSAGFIGLALSVGALAGIATSGINSWFGRRIPSLIYALGGSALIWGSYLVLVAPGDWAFMLSNLLFALGWGSAQPAFWAIVSKVDATGRIFVAAPAASGIGGVAVGLLAGPIIERVGYAGLLTFSSGLIVAALVAAGVALQRSHVR